MRVLHFDRPFFILLNPNRSLEIFASKCKTVTFIMTQIFIAHLNYCHNHDVFHAK